MRRRERLCRRVVGAAFVAMLVLLGSSAGRLWAQSGAVQSAASPRVSSVEAFQTFWTEFRRAVLAKDNDRIADMTHFPLIVHGLTDADPVERCDKARFPTLCEKLLRRDTGLGDNTPLSEFDFIRKKKIIYEDDFQGDTTGIRLGDFVFSKIGGHWYFAEGFHD